MTKFKRLLAFMLTLVMITLAVAPLSACGNIDDEDSCTNHVDNDGDGKCDNDGCDATVETGKCTSHVDSNGDGWCDNNGCGQPVNPDSKVNYTVQVKTVGGYYPEGLEMDLIDSATGELAAYARTDAQGVVTFKNVTPKTTYVASFAEIVDTNKTKVNTFLKGYTYEESYPVSASGTVITLVSKLQEEGHSGVSYELGDIMHDFTMTDSDGNKQTLSEILKTKKAVVLNFWYVDCSWCVEEFPDILAAYETVIDEETGAQYKDVIEVLAIDPSSDTIASIRSFKNGYGLTFPMGKDPDGVAAAFGVSAYPTTVIVDRYGMVSVMHSGALLGSSYWKKLFAYYSSDDYVQRTAGSFAELIPQDVPDVEQPSSDEIADYFNGDTDLKVTYHPETKPGDAEYSWPFVTTTVKDKNGNDIKCIIPSNSGKDNSYATIYAEIELAKGEALMFDFHSSTEYTETNADVLYVIVDGKDMYSIAGLEDDDVWKSCCAFVAKESGTYEVAFTYLKDTADDNLEGVLDLVYLTNLRTVDESEVDVETYIYRYADELNPDTDLVLNNNDGYYHVGTADGPILLANLLGYTKFDSNKIVTERLYETYIFEVDGVDKFYHFELYANYSSNSSIYGYASVTPELKEYLDAYVKEHAIDVEKQYTSELWLSLCAYYDAYGTDGEQLEDPIKGLSTFSAYDTVLTTDENDPQYNEVEFTRVVMPRGYLYKFVPTASGVYRIVTQSAKEVNSWIFVGNHDEWAEAGGNRTFYTDSNQGERINPDLTVDPDGDGVYERDTTNASMVAYLEEGVEYYLSFGFYDVYEFSKFTFTVRYTHESFNAFLEASPGPFTYEENLDGSVGKTIAGGIDVALASDGYYYHHKVSSTKTSAPADITSGDAYFGKGDGIYYEYEYEDESENWVTKRTTVVVSAGKKTVTVEEYTRGSKVYADFILPTNIFMSRTMKQLLDNYAFDFTKTASDLEGLAMYVSYARYGFEMKWLEEKFDEAFPNGTDEQLDVYIKEMTYNENGLLSLFETMWADSGREADLKAEGKTSKEIAAIKQGEWESYYEEKAAAQKAWDDEFEARWESEDLQKIADGLYTETYFDTPEAKEFAKLAKEVFFEQYGDEAAATWAIYEMDDLLAGIFHGDIYTANDQVLVDLYIAAAREQLQAIWGGDYMNNWSSYKMVDVVAAFRNGALATADLSAEAVQIFKDAARAGLEAEWGEEFEANWAYYLVDDIIAGKFHNDLTEQFRAIYEANIEYDQDGNVVYDEDYPELQGCVAVDKELGEILQKLMDKFTFRGVENSWTKLCYYYVYLGPAAE